MLEKALKTFLRTVRGKSIAEVCVVSLVMLLLVLLVLINSLNSLHYLDQHEVLKFTIVCGVVLFLLVCFVFIVFASEKARRLSIARHRVESYLDKTKRAGFGKIRSNVDSSYSDHFLTALVDEYHDVFRFCDVKHQEQQETVRGITLVKRDREDSQSDPADDGRTQQQDANHRAVLRIEYEPAKHFTKHPNGIIEVRIVVRNTGNGGANRIRVKLDSLVPLSNKNDASPYSTQFNALRLQVVRQELEFSLHSQESAEVIILEADKSGADFLIHGYDTQPEPQRQTFKTPRAKYHMTVIATALDATSDSKTFIVSPKRNGEIDFSVC
jgi:hypothetical protein